VSHFVSHKPFISADWPSGYLFISVWQCERDIIFAPIFDCVSVLGVVVGACSVGVVGVVALVFVDVGSW
jgi:hypothetical protein